MDGKKMNKKVDVAYREQFDKLCEEFEIEPEAMEWVAKDTMDTCLKFHKIVDEELSIKKDDGSTYQDIRRIVFPLWMLTNYFLVNYLSEERRHVFLNRLCTSVMDIKN